MNARANIKADTSSRLPRHHAPAMAHKCAIEFVAVDAVEIFKKTPSIVDSQPTGRDVAKDLFEVDGIPFHVMTQLAGGEPAERRESWKLEAKCGSGAIREFARQVGPAVNVSDHPSGWCQEKQRYADI